MLVEINLLPRKERKKSAFTFAILLFVFLFLVAGGFFYLSMTSLSNDLKTVNEKISRIKSLSTKENEKALSRVGDDSFNQLVAAIEWAEKYPVKSVNVMRHLTSLLPERGFIQSYEYSENGKLKVLIQFDTTEEAAFYLSRLNDSKWFKEAVLISLVSLESDNNTQNETISAVTPSEFLFLPRIAGEFEMELDRDKAKKYADEDDMEGNEGT